MTRLSAEAIQVAVNDAFLALLPQAEIQPEDNFFALGGNSVGVAQVLALLRENGINVTAREFVADPTPSGVARRAAGG